MHLLTFFFFVVFKSSVGQSDHNLRKIALNAFYNISTLGSIEQIKVLLDHDLLHLLCYQLDCPINIHEDILEVSLLTIFKQVDIFISNFNGQNFDIQFIIAMNSLLIPNFH